MGVRCAATGRSRMREVPSGWHSTMSLLVAFQCPRVAACSGAACVHLQHGALGERYLWAALVDQREGVAVGRQPLVLGGSSERHSSAPATSDGAWHPARLPRYARQFVRSPWGQRSSTFRPGSRRTKAGWRHRPQRAGSRRSTRSRRTPRASAASRLHRSLSILRNASPLEAWSVLLLARPALV